jgi:hypothetical protein
MYTRTIVIAVAETGKRNEVREYGKIANTSTALKAVAVRLVRTGHELRFWGLPHKWGQAAIRAISIRRTDKEHDRDRQARWRLLHDAGYLQLLIPNTGWDCCVLTRSLHYTGGGVGADRRKVPEPLVAGSVGAIPAKGRSTDENEWSDL